jgi:acetylglutamate kinase
MLEVVVGVYAGQINKEVVAQLQANGSNAMGFSGADGNLIQSDKRNHPTIDYGFVGDVDGINESFITQLLNSNIKLVVAPITHDGQGQLLNTNADTIAQSIATGMAKHFEVHLIYGFERDGVLSDLNDPSSVITFIDRPFYGTLKDQKVIFEGMIPKIDNAYLALEGGVQSVIIGKAEKLNQLIDGTSGTTIKI